MEITDEMEHSQQQELEQQHLQHELADLVYEVQYDELDEPHLMHDLMEQLMHQ